MNYRKLLYFFLCTVIILLSFFLYSSRFYPLLGSDDALSILMAHYYKFPHDLYCWGQDRGGAIVPLISQIFIKLFNSPAVISVSISNYLLLILGYFSLASLIKSNYYKIIFAIIWFLPFQRFIGITRFPIGIEYSLLGLTIFLICKLDEAKSAGRFVRHIIFSCIVIIVTITVWVSDLAVVSVVELIFVISLFSFLKYRRVRIDKIALFYILSGAIVCFLLIRYAKTFAVTKTGGYMAINGPGEVKQTLLIIKNAFSGVLSFGTHEVFVSIYAYSVILFLIIFLVFILKKKLLTRLMSDKWIVFFLVDAVGIFIVLLLSSWVLANGVGRWYFVATYISLSVFVILALDKIEVLAKVKILRLGILLVALIGAFSPVYEMKFDNPKSLKPMVDVVGEFKQLGEIGIIGDYWNSYIISCADPEKIKATQNDLSEVRNQEMVDMVFERKKIYVIKDMWFDQFPDTLEQFGYVLTRAGAQFRLGGCDVCEYRKIKLYKVFPLEKLKYSNDQVISDSMGTKKALFVRADCDSCREKIFVYGPYIPIGIGAFTVSFNLQAENFTNGKPVALLDVVADWGRTRLAEKTITRDDFLTSSCTIINIDFRTCKRYNNVEFRIYYYGNADMYFDQITLKEN